MYVTYVVSTLSTGVPVLCGLVSALMHYFFLAVFFWMAAEAIHLHRKLVTVFKPDIKNYVAITVAICWGRLYSIIYIIIYNLPPPHSASSNAHPHVFVHISK